MTTILISADDQDLGADLGRKLAAALGYGFLGRELLVHLAEEHSLPVHRLELVLDDKAGRRLSSKSRDLLLARIKRATLERLLDDRQVCVGLGAHLYVRDVSHVLTVRVLADAKARAGSLVARDGIPLRKAQRILARERERRTEWSLEGFGHDECDASIYDIVVGLGTIEPERAVQVVEELAGYRKFEPMSYSRKCLANLALAARIRADLLPDYPELRVSADGDTVTVYARCARRHSRSVAAAIKETAGKLPGVRLVKVHTVTSRRALVDD